MKITRTLSRKAALLGAVTVLAAGSVTAATTSPAAASAATCLQYDIKSTMCTYVMGHGTWVDHVQSQFFTTWAICNYNAWVFYIPPSGGAYGLAWLTRYGCSYGAAYLQANINRSFPVGTLICSKFYKDYGTFVGQKCVGLSG